MQDFLRALGFLTIIPCSPGLRSGGNGRDDNGRESMGFARSVSFFPLVGGVIGFTLALVYRIALYVFPGVISSVLVLISEAIITGGIHLDGFMDTADGVLSGRSRERILEIMKDSRVGSMGAMSIVFLLLLKLAFLVELPYGFRYQSLIIMPVLGRWAMAYAIYAFPYARPGGGLGSSFAEFTRERELFLASFIGFLITAALLMTGGLMTGGLPWGKAKLALVGILGVGILGGVTLAALTFSRWIARRIGGMTGDTYGATCELVEVFSLMVIVGISRSLAS